MGKVASSYARLAAAKQEMRKIKRQTDLGDKALNLTSETLGFLKSQVERSKTAWEEYEKGVEVQGLGGFDVQKPSLLKKLSETLIPFGKKGFLEKYYMPKGKVILKGKEYDREELRKIGARKKEWDDIRARMEADKEAIKDNLWDQLLVPAVVQGTKKPNVVQSTKKAKDLK